MKIEGYMSRIQELRNQQITIPNYGEQAYFKKFLLIKLSSKIDSEEDRSLGNESTFKMKNKIRDNEVDISLGKES